MKSFVEVLCTRAIEQPDRDVYTFLVDGETEAIKLTCRELDEKARSIAVHLETLCGRGARALLLFPPGLDYIAAFWGCLYAGVVAVPAYPPRMNRNLQRIQAIVADSDAAIALTTSATLARIQPLLAHEQALENLAWITTDDLTSDVASAWRMPDIDRKTLAFLQYTSGSSGTPKGVMVTHGNLLHNELMIQRAFRQTKESVIVGWLPLYHDMGLIGNVLQPLFTGSRCVLMSHVAFLKRPLRWLQAISRHRATTSGAPNFAYDLCARRITAEERATLDLSSWTTAFNGSEPVRADTLELFSETFKSCGFRASAFTPCYGLAEATLFVSGGFKSRGSNIKSFGATALEQNRAIETNEDDEGSRSLVSCGSSSGEQQVVIVDPKSGAINGPNEVGEIWIAGESVASGYWKRPKDTEDTFGARLAGLDGSFLRTGDQGFLHQGELFITGRVKDLIIIRGRNLYPQDIEKTVEESHGILRPTGAAFSVDLDGEERLVVVQETERNTSADYEEILNAVREAIAEEYEINVYAVLLVKAGGVPRTSSGKIQRRACREMFLSDRFEPLAQWRESATAQRLPQIPASLEKPRSVEDIEDWLRTQLANKTGLNISRIDIEQPITHYGIDSLATIELMHDIETALGLVIPFTNFYRSPSIASIANAAAHELCLPSPPAAAVVSTETPVAHDGPPALHPLSYGQQAMWFLYCLAPENAAYNIPVTVRLHSEIDVVALRAAFQALVDRHAMLRTTFTTHDGFAVQQVHKHAEVSFEKLDATGWNDARFNECLSTNASRPFNLEQGPLLSVYLIERAAGEFLMQVVTHHIITDFWSLTILLAELDIIYGALKNGATSAPLPPLQSHYTDYVRQQTRALEGPDGERLWSFWEKELGGELLVLNLLTDRPRTAMQSNRGAIHTFSLNNELTSQLKQLSRRSGTTLYVTLLAAYNVLLSRYTGQSEIVVGSPIAGRNRAVHSAVVGYFVNLLPLRSHLDGNPRFVELLQQVRATVLDAFTHHEYPFALIVQRLHPGRETSRTPLFQTMFVMQQMPAPAIQGLAPFALGAGGACVKLNELELESVALDQRATQFDLTLAVANDGDGLLASLEYNADLFDRTTIESMSQHFTELLASIANDPEEHIDSLRLLTKSEEEQLLLEWNDTGRDYPESASMLSLFNAQVRRTPDALALSCGTQHLSYRELDEQSNRLANYLRDRGLGVEQVVAVLLHRTPELVTTLLAVLKAGAAYLPLDPAYPAERLRLMLEDSQARVLITTNELAGLVDGIRSEVLCLDAESDEIVRASRDPLTDFALHPDNLAYLIYTSGSTGRPKAAGISHRSAQTLFQWAGEAFSTDELAGVLASTSVCFDLSVFELFVPLSWGGEVILAANALELATIEGRERVRLINTVPSAMSELIRRGAVPAGVLTVNLAGEALSRVLVEDIYRETGVKRVLNLYGPSEDTTYSTFTHVERGQPNAPTIGRPIANTQVYILDQQMQPVPAGVAGELFITGDGLARGYLSRPDLTAARFVPSPFSHHFGVRLYRTGDLARWLTSGEIEFLGRIDNQVKLRGFRIELGEIEAVLQQHAAVKDSVVVVSEETGDKRLVAYVVSANAEAPVTWLELQRYLKERLPDYMLPSDFVMLNEIPLTPNGKVDRGALPAWERRRPELAHRYAAPRTPIEKIMARIWCEVLGLKRVGINDNFFDLGGHSLLATTVASRIHDSLQVDLPLRALFENPTVAELAVLVEDANNPDPAFVAQRITPLPRERLRRSRTTLSLS